MGEREGSVGKERGRERERENGKELNEWREISVLKLIANAQKNDDIKKLN